MFDSNNAYSAAGGDRFLMAGRVYDVFSGTTVNAIFNHVGNTDSDTTNRGYFVTGFFNSENINDVWNEIWVKFRKFYLAGNLIVVKYRTQEMFVDSANNPQEATMTWASTTTMTGVVPTGVVVGDEVEVLSGDNAGCTFHITTFSATPDGSSSITVTVDEAHPFTSTSAVLVRFDNWRKLQIGDSDAISDSDATARKMNLPGTASDTTDDARINEGNFMHVKVELRGAVNEVDELIIKSKKGLEV